MSVVLLRSSLTLKITAFLFVAVTFFYLGKHWSDGNGYQQLVFFSSNLIPNPVVSTSPNINKQFDVESLIDNNQAEPEPEKAPDWLPPPSQPPPPSPVNKFGIVNENGTMAEEFDVGDDFLDPAMMEEWVNETQVATDKEEGSAAARERFTIKRFGLCPRSMSEYIPCLDNVEAIKKLPSIRKGQSFERHCPEQGRGLSCLVPPPNGYQTPIPWPKSRDEVHCHFLISE